MVVKITKTPFRLLMNKEKLSQDGIEIGDVCTIADYNLNGKRGNYLMENTKGEWGSVNKECFIVLQNS